MRTIFILGILAMGAFMAGWFTIHRDDEGTTIRFNRDEIHGDTRQAIDRGRELLDRNNRAGANEQIARQPGQPHLSNAPSGYDPQGRGYPPPSTDPPYQGYPNQNYQNQDFPYQNQTYQNQPFQDGQYQQPYPNNGNQGGGYR